VKISKIRIQNFRILRDVVIDLEEDLSVVIGKNNCGKTSFLLVLDKFIGSGYAKNVFCFNDFNISLKEELKSYLENDEPKEIINYVNQKFGISLKIFIEYDESDDLSNVGNTVIMDLDPLNKTIVLAFEYYLSEEKLKELKKDFIAFRDQQSSKEKPKDYFWFMKEKQTKYFQLSSKSLFYDFEKGKEIEDEFIDLRKEKVNINKIINFKWISAKREVSNKDSEKSLSSLSCKIYKKLEANNEGSAVEKFKEVLSQTDEALNSVYDSLFSDIIQDVRNLGGIKKDESIIQIVSSLQHKDLLAENTTVMYGFGTHGHSLPESYNGLGYMNLICMIFEIKILLHEFQKEKSENPSDINLLFIEEPEVHTHPQMQRIFIQNIKTLLKEDIKGIDGKDRKLQAILTTHSSHIVSESKFENIKYFKKINNSIVSKNLKDLEKKYRNNKEYYKFLKQYLTLHRAEIFFADKAIFIEGDTERILLPVMMKKIDQEIAQKVSENIFSADEEPHDSLPLLSQNISIIEVGAYSKIFEIFIDFIGIKSLIITDIDSIGFPSENKNGDSASNFNSRKNCKRNACQVADGDQTSNDSLKFFHGHNKTLSDFVSLSREKSENRLLRKGENGWEIAPDGYLLCVFQAEEKNSEGVTYHARSFEDAFFHINVKFIKEKVLDDQDNLLKDHPFQSLTQKHLKNFVSGDQHDPYKMAIKGVNGKPSFAMEILLASLENSEWNIPKYIKDGLQWLKQD
jgi:putative ATP-dependent endonuclease of OLD family